MSARRSGYPSTEASSPKVAAALLGTCLLLVRPVGMSDDQAEEWLVIAARAVCHLPLDILKYACGEAQGVATHHGQIVPAILKAGNTRFDERRRHLAFVEDFKLAPALPAPPIIPPAPEEVRELAAVIGKAADKFRAVESDRWAERRAERAALYPTVKVDPNASRTLAELVAGWDAAASGEVLQ